MMRALYSLLFVLALTAGSTAQTPQLQNAFPNLTFDEPTDIQAPDDGSNRLFITEHAGRIRVVENDPGATEAPIFLDITDRVTQGTGISDSGLLGLAFDPGYALNGYFYVHYTAAAPLRTVIARFRVSDDPNAADPDSETILLQIGNLATDYHKGGQLRFGPATPSGDRYLYASIGDGGPQGDPLRNGQNLGVLLGKLLRLDVDGGGLPLDCGAGTGTATVPTSNPFVGRPGACDEIYAYGFRNPYKFSFGPGGRLWLGDVGYNSWEEVDLVVAGGNYGWKRFEGAHCLDPASTCDPSGVVFPIHEYGHAFTPGGGFSITGGYVYTGASCVELLGRYVYGDFVTGNVWALDYDGVTADNDLLLPLTGNNISTFGEDEQGELLLSNYGAGTLLRLECGSAVTVAAVAVGQALIPPDGGPFEFDVTLTNQTARRQTFDVWADADLPDGTERRPVVSPRAVTLLPGASLTSRVRLHVPADALAGVSTLTVKVGGFPDAPADSDRLTVLKQGAATAGVRSLWEVAGWSDEAGLAAVKAGDAVALSVSPNPFDATTTIRFVLAEGGPVRLAVYDVLGREVAVLANGALEAGAHTAVLEGRALPSGAYLVRLRTGSAETTQRITLLR